MKQLKKTVSAVTAGASSLCAAFLKAGVSLKKISVKAAAVVLAVFVFMGGFCEYCAPAVAAAEVDADYRNLSFELYPEGEQEEKTVVLNGVMPKDACAEAVDVTGDYADPNGNTDISEDNPNASLLAAYNITITDGGNEYQPDEDKPIRVDITNPFLSEERVLELWHIKDSGEKERIEEFTVEDGRISFTAVGFSVYAIVDVSAPYAMEEISGLDDLEGSRATSGFCLYYGSRKFFSGSVNGKGALTETENPSAAARWFFTREGNCYKISTMIDGVEKFIHTRSGNEIELSDSADLFEITATANNSFYLKNSIENKWLQHSGSGGGIRYYTANTNATNSRIKVVFADSMDLPDDYYRLNGKTYGLMNYPGGTIGCAFMSQDGDSCLSMLSLNVRRETGCETLYVAEDSDITLWTFHYVSGTEYKLSTTVNGETKYLNIGSTLYQNSIQRVEYVPSYTPPNSPVSYDSVYFINPGKSAEARLEH